MYQLPDPSKYIRLDSGKKKLEGKKVEPLPIEAGTKQKDNDTEEALKKPSLLLAARNRSERMKWFSNVS